MNDVFGRPMDLTPSHPVNRKPLAPNPAPGPQDEPYVGFVDAGDAVGETSAFLNAMNESIGAAHRITASQGDARSIISATSPQGTEQQYEGSYVISPAVSRWERPMPGQSGGTPDLGPVPPDYGQL